MKHKIDNDIVLTPIDLVYANEIFEGFDHSVVQFLPIGSPPDKIEETQSFVRHSMNQMELGNDLVWIILFENGFAGCCGIHDIPSKRPHFGLWIKTNVQGKGIGKKVVHYVLQWGISNLEVDYIKYPVDVRNVKSIALIKELDLISADRYEMGGQKKLDVIEYRLHKT